ncbi:MAG: type II toxin-antitoxin system VapC family toxin [Limisphaerales bacterium]
MAKPKIYYWDASVFITIFNDEPGADHVEHFLDEAEEESVVIVTSSFTPVEVLKLKGQRPITKVDKDKVRDFFKKDYFRWVDLSHLVGETAQSLIWDYPGLFPKDAVHLASALVFERISPLKLDAIHSYDNDFIKLNGKLPTKAVIMKPVPSQGVMRKLLEAAKKSPPRRIKLNE